MSDDDMGDDMGEIYPPDYQDWLDSQAPKIEEIDLELDQEKPF